MRELKKAAHHSEVVGSMVPVEKAMARLPKPANRTREPACDPEFCGGGDGRLVPDNHRRVTTVTGPDRFAVVLTDSRGRPVRSSVATCGAESDDCSATVKWKPTVGARVPTDVIDQPVVDFVQSESYALRIIPMAGPTTAPQTATYEFERTIEPKEPEGLPGVASGGDDCNE